MNISSHGKSHAGCVRENNEDAFFIDQSRLLFAVADGLGGLPDGEEASRIAVETLATLARESDDRIPPDFEDIFARINRTVHQVGASRYRDTSIGTTLTSACVQAGRLYIGHVGDSAAFLWRDEELHALTEEHTMAALYGGSHGNPGDGRLPEYYYHTLTRCIGATAQLETAVSNYEIRPGDRLLLCTDGLTKVLSPQRLCETLGSTASPRQTVEVLIEQALERGAPDNLAVVAVFAAD